MSACRIERVTSDSESEIATVDQGGAPAAPPTRDTTAAAPLTPFRSLLQGAWASNSEGVWPDATPAPQVLPGVLVMVLAADDTTSALMAHRLCVALKRGDDPTAAVGRVMGELECQLAVDPTSAREAMVASSAGDWGAAVAVPPEVSAFAIADEAREQGLGFVVARPPSEPSPLGTHVHGPEQLTLRCENAPPLGIADLSTGLSNSALSAVTDGGLPSLTADDDAGVMDAVASDEGTQAWDQALPQPELRSKIVFVAVRDSQGHFAAAAAAATVDAKDYATAGVVALPSRRLMVGSDGVVFVDPALERQVVPGPAAALRAYDALVSGEPVEDDIAFIRSSGGHVVDMPGMRYAHVDTTDADARCPMEAVP